MNDALPPAEKPRPTVPPEPALSRAEGGNRRTRRPRVTGEAAFRALVEERLRNLEGQLTEVKTRLNGLLFFIAGTVIAQVLLRLFA
jgi:hypothetical protein